MPAALPRAQLARASRSRAHLLRHHPRRQTGAHCRECRSGHSLESRCAGQGSHQQSHHCRRVRRPLQGRGHRAMDLTSGGRRGARLPLTLTTLARREIASFWTNGYILYTTCDPNLHIDKILAQLDKTFRMSDSPPSIADKIHSLTDKIHSFTDQIHSAKDKIHSIADKIYILSDKIHSFADKIHSFIDKIHSITDEIHGVLDTPLCLANRIMHMPHQILILTGTGAPLLLPRNWRAPQSLPRRCRTYICFLNKTVSCRMSCRAPLPLPRA
eukprot:2434200-Pyramimonas_sp.AAC.1